ncbi:P-loop containing nucleoside triphosphate hydrolase protein [Phyllosticta citrichinensis]
MNTIPKFAFSCSHFAEFPKSDVPEFAFIGRSNVGKSSLLNALFYAHSYNKQHEKELARVGARAGLTKLMNVFLAGDIDGGTEIKQHNGKKRTERWIRPGRGIAIVDMPGYGFGSHNSQGEEIIKYLSRRTQLRRTFVLVNGEHGPTNLDLEMFKILAQAGISYQIVLTKTDKCLSPGNDSASVTRIKYGLELLQRTKSQLDEIVKPPLRDVLCVSAEKSLNCEGRFKHDMIGTNALRLAMLQAASMAREEPLRLPIAKIDPKESMRKKERKSPAENRGKRFEQKFLREEIRKRRLEAIKQRMQGLQMMQERRKAEEGQSQ